LLLPGKGIQYSSMRLNGEACCACLPVYNNVIMRMKSRRAEHAQQYHIPMKNCLPATTTFVAHNMHLKCQRIHKMKSNRDRKVKAG